MATSRTLDRVLVLASYVLLFVIVGFLVWDVDRRLADAQDSRCRLDDALATIILVQALGDIAQAEEAGTPYPTEALSTIEWGIEYVAEVLTEECVNAGIDIDVGDPDTLDLDGDGE